MSSPQPLPPALVIKDLRKVYKGGMEALKGVSMVVPRGQFFALLGPNGAGKTTLISIITSLSLKTSGTVEVFGTDIDKDADKAKSRIGLVPQEFNLDWFAKVIDIVVQQAGYYGIPREEALPKAEILLKKLELWEKRNEQSMKLSGGMKRRLMIARALIHDPELLLLDEPTAGVDVELRRGMWEFLRELNEKGTTIILTTHYLEEAEQLCREVAIVNKGIVVEQGGVKELLTKLNYVTLVLDATEPVKDAALVLLRELSIKRVDEMTLELTLSPGETVNDAMRTISKTGIQIANIRNNGSRLEEIFINLIEKDKKEN